jgi:hypothetical protein
MMRNISKNRTVKTYVEQMKKSSSEASDLSLGGGWQEDLVSSFDHMSAILKAKGVKEGEIFLIDGDKDALVNLIALIKGADTEEVKIGVLFRVNGHTTPFCIEKKIDENDVETMVVYNTDSVVMDIDQGDAVRDVVRRIAQETKIYSLGFADPKGEILRDFKRQSDIGSCATYALFDIEEIIKDGDFSKFVAENHTATTENNIFDINALPLVFMSTIQSINGSEESGTVVRNGMSYFIERNEISKDHQITINGEVTDLLTLMQEIKEADILNPVMAIMNAANLALYDNACNNYDEASFEIYTLGGAKFLSQSKRLGEAIFDVACKQREDGSDVSEFDDSDLPSLKDGPKLRSGDNAKHERSTIGYVLDRVSDRVKSPDKSKGTDVTTLLTDLRRLDAERGTDIVSQIVLMVGLAVIVSVQYQQEQLLKKINLTKKVETGERDEPCGRDGNPTSDEESENSISDDEMAQSAFGRGSNTAKLLERRREGATLSRER